VQVGKKLEKSVFLAKCLEMSIKLIIYPCKVILTRLRPVPKPKYEKVGLNGPGGHPSPVEKGFIPFLYRNLTLLGIDRTG
jgi:hypothetical protein